MQTTAMGDWKNEHLWNRDNQPPDILVWIRKNSGKGGRRELREKSGASCAGSRAGNSHASWRRRKLRGHGNIYERRSCERIVRLRL